MHLRVGDGYQGWPEEAPFDAIIVTCAPDKVSQPLLDQLKDDGRTRSFPSQRFANSFTSWKRKMVS